MRTTKTNNKMSSFGIVHAMALKYVPMRIVLILLQLCQNYNGHHQYLIFSHIKRFFWLALHSCLALLMSLLPSSPVRVVQP